MEGGGNVGWSRGVIWDGMGDGVDGVVVWDVVVGWSGGCCGVGWDGGMSGGRGDVG